MYHTCKLPPYHKMLLLFLKMKKKAKGKKSRKGESEQGKKNKIRECGQEGGKAVEKNRFRLSLVQI